MEHVIVSDKGRDVSKLKSIKEGVGMIFDTCSIKHYIAREEPLKISLTSNIPFSPFQLEQRKNA